jgi:hypothetical protein
MITEREYILRIFDCLAQRLYILESSSEAETTTLCRVREKIKKPQKRILGG